MKLYLKPSGRIIVWSDDPKGCIFYSLCHPSKKAKIDENYHQDCAVKILKCGGGSDLVWLLRSADIRLLTIINGIKNTHVYQDFLKKNVTVPEEDGLCCIICA